MMKPFDLEKALAGDPVVTRDGREVKDFAFFPHSTSNSPVRAVIDGVIHSYTVDGLYISLDNYHELDLFMAPKKRTVWVNLYKNMASGYNRGFFYDTEELANKTASAGRIGDKAYQIEIEE